MGHYEGSQSSVSNSPAFPASRERKSQESVRDRMAATESIWPCPRTFADSSRWQIRAAPVARARSTSQLARKRDEVCTADEIADSLRGRLQPAGLRFQKRANSF